MDTINSKQQPKEGEQKNKSTGIALKIKSDILKKIIIGLVVFAIAILIFKAGMFVGMAKARFSYRWAENYHRNFGGPRGGFIGQWQKPLFGPDDLIEGHGVVGSVLQVGTSTLTIKGRGNVEKIVVIDKNTTIERFRETIKLSDLKVNDYVVIIGSPNDAGQTEAKLIRVVPFSSEAPFPPRAVISGGWVFNKKF